MNKDYLIYKLSETVKETSRIDNELFKRYGVKRGLRNEDHSGVLVGLTNIGNVVGYERLPDGSGLELLRRIRRSSAVPVILLTANDMELDEVTGLESGADDYITKPFSLAVLRARVAAQLRRGKPESRERLELGPFSFDFQTMEFRRDGRAVELSKTEQRLLRVLVENRGRTLPRSLLVDRVWTDGAEYVDENALSVTVKRLRGKLEKDPANPEYIKTVYGIGYTWAVKP